MAEVEHIVIPLPSSLHIWIGTNKELVQKHIQTIAQQEKINIECDIQNHQINITTTTSFGNLLRETNAYIASIQASVTKNMGQSTSVSREEDVTTHAQPINDVDEWHEDELPGSHIESNMTGHDVVYTQVPKPNMEAAAVFEVLKAPIDLTKSLVQTTRKATTPIVNDGSTSLQSKPLSSQDGSGMKTERAYATASRSPITSPRNSPANPPSHSISQKSTMIGGHHHDGDDEDSDIIDGPRRQRRPLAATSNKTNGTLREEKREVIVISSDSEEDERRLRRAAKSRGSKASPSASNAPTSVKKKGPSVLDRIIVDFTRTDNFPTSGSNTYANIMHHRLSPNPSKGFAEPSAFSSDDDTGSLRRSPLTPYSPSDARVNRRDTPFVDSSQRQESAPPQPPIEHNARDAQSTRKETAALVRIPSPRAKQDIRFFYHPSAENGAFDTDDEYVDGVIRQRRNRVDAPVSSDEGSDSDEQYRRRRQANKDKKLFSDSENDEELKGDQLGDEIKEFMPRQTAFKPQNRTKCITDDVGTTDRTNAVEEDVVQDKSMESEEKVKSEKVLGGIKIPSHLNLRVRDMSDEQVREMREKIKNNIRLQLKKPVEVHEALKNDHQHIDGGLYRYSHDSTFRPAEEWKVIKDVRRYLREPTREERERMERETADSRDYGVECLEHRDRHHHRRDRYHDDRHRHHHDDRLIPTDAPRVAGGWGVVFDPKKSAKVAWNVNNNVVGSNFTPGLSILPLQPSRPMTSSKEVDSRQLSADHCISTNWKDNNDSKPKSRIPEMNGNSSMKPIKIPFSDTHMTNDWSVPRTLQLSNNHSPLRQPLLDKNCSSSDEAGTATTARAKTTSGLPRQHKPAAKNSYVTKCEPTIGKNGMPIFKINRKPPANSEATKSATGTPSPTASSSVGAVENVAGTGTSRTSRAPASASGPPDSCDTVGFITGVSASSGDEWEVSSIKSDEHAEWLNESRDDKTRNENYTPSFTKETSLSLMHDTTRQGIEYWEDLILQWFQENSTYRPPPTFPLPPRVREHLARAPEVTRSEFTQTELHAADAATAPFTGTAISDDDDPGAVCDDNSKHRSENAATLPSSPLSTASSATVRPRASSVHSPSHTNTVTSPPARTLPASSLAVAPPAIRQKTLKLKMKIGSGRSTRILVVRIEPHDAPHAYDVVMRQARESGTTPAIATAIWEKAKSTIRSRFGNTLGEPNVNSISNGNNVGWVDSSSWPPSV
ncbi:hypothetical protein SeMB42_g01244 [Synchytrium endobioticum]|uniref:Uncharacterized protein n=1 Tax=Synchytrium endobioticum TaxID=286115 RepID=A0A507DP79_9FUNG|nr:hypothetical protein SeMB42_g01244 [Synchytrium endobioticum]